jgi:hypothetical protein
LAAKPLGPVSFYEKWGRRGGRLGFASFSLFDFLLLALLLAESYSSRPSLLLA